MPWQRGETGCWHCANSEIEMMRHQKLDALMNAGLDIKTETSRLLEIHASELEQTTCIDDVIRLNLRYDGYIDIPVGQMLHSKTSQARRYVARKDSGAYYTPDDIVSFLVQSCLIEPLRALEPKQAIEALKTLKILDPAMGTGAFILRACERLMAFAETVICDNRELLGVYAHILQNGIYGMDINPRAVALVCQSLSRIAELKQVQCSDLTFKLVVGNAIASPLQCHLEIWPEKYPKPKRFNLKEWFKAHRWNPIPEDFDEKGKFHPFRVDEAFADVFIGDKPGFDVILMNPPWNKLVMGRKAWFRAHIDETVYANKRARDAAIAELESVLEPEWLAYEAHEAECLKRIDDTSARKVCGMTEQKQGHVDACAMFLERAWLLLKPGGMLGCVLPNAFYANHGAEQERRLMFLHSHPHFLFGFQNKCKIFPKVAAGLRFCLLKTQKPSDAQVSAVSSLKEPAVLPVTSPEHKVETGFGFTHMAELEAARLQGKTVYAKMSQSLGMNGEIVAECASQKELESRSQFMETAETFADYMDRYGLNLGQEINVTLCAPYMVDVDPVRKKLGLSTSDARQEPVFSQILKAGYLVFHEKGSFGAYDTGLKANVRYLLDAQAWRQNKQSPQKLAASAHYRVACRSTIHAAERDKSVFALIPPGCVVGNSALVECYPENRELKYALAMMAVANTSVVNQAARLLIGTNMKRFLIRQLPFPKLDENEIERLAKLALRLCLPVSCYAPLCQQFGVSPAESDTVRLDIQNEIENRVMTAMKR